MPNCIKESLEDYKIKLIIKRSFKYINFYYYIVYNILYIHIYMRNIIIRVCDNAMNIHTFPIKNFNERLFLLASPASSISSSPRVRVFDTRSFAPGCLGPSGSIFVGTHPKCARTKDSVRYRGSWWLLLSATTATSRLIERVV